MTVEFIREICEKYNLDADKLDRLVEAYNDIRQDVAMSKKFDELVQALSNAGADDPVWEWDYKFDIKNADCCKFLLLLGCVEVTKEEVIRRGIPASDYECVPGRRIAPHIERYNKTGNCDVPDFPWDRNFYTHQIYLMDRFYFIPCIFGDTFRLYRNTATNKVVGIYEAGHGVAEDGQLVTYENKDAEVVFKTEMSETEDEYIGNYMNPCGFISREIVHLKKSEWKEVLKPGDKMIAFHIPGGEGYNPSRLQNSMQMALDFFRKYYPEIDFKGFWSDSWLYDNRLSFLLPAESNIVSVQRRFYNYSVGGGGDMIKLEVFGSADVDLTKVEVKTSLEKKIIEAIANGNRFCKEGMIVLPEEVPAIEAGYTYITEEDIAEHEKVVHSLWK